MFKGRTIISNNYFLITSKTNATARNYYFMCLRSKVALSPEMSSRNFQHSFVLTDRVSVVSLKKLTLIRT